MAEPYVWVVIPKDVRQAPYTTNVETLIEDEMMREITRAVPERIYNEYHSYAQKTLDIRREMLDNYRKPIVTVTVSEARG